MNRNERREKTNSMTHLTKILIKETMESDLKTIYNRLCQLETKELKEKTIIDATEALNNIKNNLDHRGECWSQKENDLFLNEMKVAIKTIAANHGRTVEAITARLNHLGMTHCPSCPEN